MDERQQQADFEFYSALYVDQGYSKEEAEERARKLIGLVDEGEV